MAFQRLRPNLKLLSSFCHTFRRTLGVHFQNPPLKPQRCFSALYHSLEFRPETRFHDLPRSDFLGEIERVSHLPTDAEAVSALKSSGLELTSESVRSAIWGLREDPRLASLAFRWGESLGCCDEEAWCLMIWVLGTHREFESAWSLVGAFHEASMDSRRARVIMVDRYAHAENPGKAVWAFEMMENFCLSYDQEALYASLNALCKHGYMEEAEDFMLRNKDLFPLETKGFNIILNGWCNITVDLAEAKRIRREMDKQCIYPDETTYTHMLSCYSNVGMLVESLKLHCQMKQRGWTLSIEVYNSLVSVLTRENCFKEALKFVEKMKESGLKPDSNTYNGMIKYLCRLKKLDEARDMLATMVDAGINLTTETYHSFLGILEYEETLEFLVRMKRSSLGPGKEAFRIVLEKFFELNQPENAINIWEVMKSYEIAPEGIHYTVMVQGLAKFGSLDRAREFLDAMSANGFVVDPKLKILVKEPVSSDKEPEDRKVSMKPVNQDPEGYYERRRRLMEMEQERTKRHEEKNSRRKYF